MSRKEIEDYLNKQAELEDKLINNKIDGWQFMEELQALRLKTFGNNKVIKNLKDAGVVNNKGTLIIDLSSKESK